MNLVGGGDTVQSIKVRSLNQDNLDALTFTKECNKYHFKGDAEGLGAVWPWVPAGLLSYDRVYACVPEHSQGFQSSRMIFKCPLLRLSAAWRRGKVVKGWWRHVSVGRGRPLQAADGPHLGPTQDPLVNLLWNKYCIHDKYFDHFSITTYLKVYFSILTILLLVMEKNVSAKVAKKVTFTLLIFFLVTFTSQILTLIV